MAKSKSHIRDAEELIERFGGIRPLAAKMKVSHSTVQGWKERKAIPASRTEQIVKLGAEYDVTVKDLIDSGNEKGSSAQSLRAVKTISSAETEKHVRVSADTASNENETQEKSPAMSKKSNHSENIDHDEILAAIETAKKENRQQSLWIAIALIVMTLVAGSVLLSPKAIETRNEVDGIKESIALNKANVEYVKQDQSLLKNVLSKDWEGEIANLRAQTEQAKQTLDQALNRAEELGGTVAAVSTDVLGENAGNIEQRLTKLETHLQEFLGEPVLADMITRLRTLQGDLQGGLQLDDITQQLNTVIEASANTPQVNVNEALSEAVEADPQLAQTFGNVPPEDLKAAAVLFGLNQFRAALNRGGKPFDEDLTLVTNLVAGDNPEFAARLQTLSSHAESGVLTVGGLGKEFRTIAGDAVVASLQGEDASVQDRAQARLNELFSVEQDGELVTGTDTQATMARTQSLIEQGDLNAALNRLQGLEGPEAQVVAPFLSQLEATMKAQDIETVLTQTIQATAFGRGGSGAAGNITASGTGAIGSGTFYRDEKTGLVIYRP